jgi:outer membrane protein TolC
VQAGLELWDKPAEKVALLTQFVELAREAEKIAQTRHDAARASVVELHRTRYQRLDAEIQLLRARREADKAKGK